jgi:hypothetical protein
MNPERRPWAGLESRLLLNKATMLDLPRGARPFGRSTAACRMKRWTGARVPQSAQG